jgi:chitodextrinase
MKKTLFLFSFILTFTITAQENYYNDVDLTAEGIALKENLATKTISAHTNILSYGWGAFQEGDLNPENSSEVLLIYGYSASGKTARTRGVNQNGGDQGDWNREHTYAKSLGTPNLGTSGPGADAHHLRPSDVGYNSERGSKKFADGSGNSGSVSGGWYPGDEWKGDIARMMMYMYIRYGDRCKPSGVGVGSTSSTPDDMIDLFLEWNAEDPVSDFERQRNTYHENRSNTYAQGNRNPFIDNAYLATKIWGGTPAEDYWGIYTSNDDEAPTTPTNVSLSNITTSSIGVSWTASTDNIAVTKYEVYVDGNLDGNSTNTNYTISGLNSNTIYAVTVLAKDIANNKSTQSTAVNGTTTIDNEAPTIPTNITITNQTGNGFKASWTASSDNTVVAGYDIFVDGTFNASTVNTSYSISGLTASTSYSITILAKDEAGNKSAQSTPVNAVTTDGSNNVVELFFSEFVEGSLNNKALEIANLTSNPINLSAYSIKKQSNGAGDWINELPLSGSIGVNDVYVIIHFQADDASLVNEADLIAPEGSNYGAPVNFNGNDAVGLFKNGVLIDIVGVLNETAKNFENMTLRRKLTVTTPNTTYDANEWDQYDLGVYDGIGIYDPNTASVSSINFETIKMYPNPANGNKIYFKLTKEINVNIYNVLGKLIKSEKVNTKNNSIDISNFSKGVYLFKIVSKNQFITKKLIKN